MAERAEEQKQERLRSVAELTKEIVIAYVTRNTIGVADLGDLIGAVGRALGVLGRERTEPAAARPEPAVPIGRSIHDDHPRLPVLRQAAENPPAPPRTN